MKNLKDMTKKELGQELDGIEQHIAEFSYGKYELHYREAIYQEIERRGYEVGKSYKLK